MNYVHLSERVFNVPLYLHQTAAEAVGDYLMQRAAGVADASPQALTRPIDAAIAENPRGAYTIDQGVALLPISGKLVNKGGYMDAMSGIASYESVIAKLKAANADICVQGVLIEGDTPGGEVAGLAAVTQQLRAMQKPVWWIANSMTASAGYWMAATAERIAAVPQSTVGSIGTVVILRDMTKAMEKSGIGAVIVRSGAKKMLGSGLEAHSAEFLSSVQARVDAANDVFIAHVAEERGLSADKIRELEGDAFTAEEAKSLKLIDTVATVEDFHRSFVAALKKGSSIAGAKSIATSPKGNTMSEVTLSQEELNARLAAARTEGATAGAQSERERISAILGSAEAKGRATLANFIAFDTDMPVEKAVTKLAGTTKETAAADADLGAPENLLAAAMANKKNPDVHAGNDAPKTEGKQTPSLDEKVSAIHKRAEAEFGKPQPGIR